MIDRAEIDTKADELGVHFIERTSRFVIVMLTFAERGVRTPGKI